MTLSTNRSMRLTLLGLILFAGIFGFVATLNGIDWSMDSAWYFTYARSVSEGQGLTAPITSWSDAQIRMSITQWPPLYPLILAPAATSIEALARLISIVSLVITGIMTFLIGLRLYGGRWKAALLVALLVIMMPHALQDVFAVAHSEAPFTAVSLTAIYLLFAYSKDQFPAPRHTLILMFLLMSASLLRYIGAAFIVLALLVMTVQLWRARRFQNWPHLLLIALSALPLALYLIYLHSETGRFTGAQSVTDSLTLEDVPNALRLIATQLNHGMAGLLSVAGIRSNWASLPITLSIVAGLALLAYRERAIQLNANLLILVGAMLCYMSLFWVSAVPSEAVVARDTRHYAIVYPMVYLLIGTLFVHWRRRYLLLPIVGLWLWSSVAAIPNIQRGTLYNAALYREHITPVLIEFAQDIPNDTLWHTMHIGYVSHLLGNDKTVRSLSIEDMFAQLRCSDVIFPDGYDHAAFVAIDEAILRNRTSAQIVDQFETWIRPCGTLLNSYSTSHIMILLARLDR